MSARRLNNAFLWLALALLLLASSRDAFALEHPYYPNFSALMAACNAHRNAREATSPGTSTPCVKAPAPVECGGPFPTLMCDRVNYRHAGFGFELWGGASPIGPPNPCEDKEGDTYEAWQYTSGWPPAGGGCTGECLVTHEALSRPLPSGIEGKVVYRARSTYTGAQCEIGDEQTEESDEEDAGDGWKCDPKTGLCTDPDGNGKLCTFNPDGSRSACVDYTPGDGTDPAPEDPEEPDDPRDQESVSGGGTCDAAPACSGTGKIACATLWQQWKTRCAVEKSGTTVGSNATCSERLSTGYACIGDTATCRTLNDTHAIRCSIAGLSNAGGGSGTGDGDDPFDKAGERAAIDAASQHGDGNNGHEPGDAWVDGDEAELNANRLGTGGGCPTLPAVSVGGSTLVAPPAFCEHIAKIRLLILAIGYIIAVRIALGN